MELSKTKRNDLEWRQRHKVTGTLARHQATARKDTYTQRYRTMPAPIRPSKISAAVVLWTMLQGPWLFSPSLFPESRYGTHLYWLTAALPILAILTAWKKQSTLILQSVFPLSLLPFALLVPDSIQTQSHTLWTMIPIIFLWLFIIFPETKNSSGHESSARKTGRIFWFWFTGAIGILLTSAALDTETEPFLLGLWTIGFSILWICFWALIVRYKIS